VSRDLNHHRWDDTSQNGEDGLLAYLIASYPQVPHICLEVGAGDGVKLSNTHRLWSQHGWQALLIERRAERLQSRFGGLPNVRIVPDAIAPQGEQSLDAISAREGFPAAIGIASIDIDSCDYWVLHHLRRLRPSIIVIEFNARIPWHIDYCDPEGALFLRHSATAVARLAKEKGYRVVACAGPNVILVDEATIATNPAAVPDLPLGDIYDHTYAARFSPILVTAQHVTDVPVYAQRPGPLDRAYGLSRYVWATAKDRINRRPAKVHRVGPALRAHVEASGLWL